MMVVKIKKQKVKRKLEWESSKSCLEATQLVNEINYLERSEIGVDSLKKVHKNS